MAEPTTNDMQSPLPLAEKLGLETTPTKPLCHYTSQTGLIGILKSKAMWATDAGYLNDSQEVIYAVNLANRYFRDRRHKDLRRVMEMSNILEQTEGLIDKLPVYVASFSEEPDLLSQWRGYCPSGPGFAVCFTADQMAQVATSKNWMLFKCIYDVEQQFEVIKQMDEHAESCYEAGTTPPVQVMFGIALFHFATVLKHPKFKEEAEWRAIQRVGGTPSVRPGASTLIPYINFQLTMNPTDSLKLAGLVVGPTPHARRAVRAVKALFAERNVICPEPRSSEIPFRNW
jgi:Protein of unknown function (DUF2971)